VSIVDSVGARLAGRQHGVVGSWQLLALGVKASAITRRLADGRLRRMHRGVYAVGPLDRKGFWMAAVLAAGEGAVLSHRDAAMLWDLRQTNRRAVDVTVVGTSRRSRPRLTIHSAIELHPDDRAEVDGIPVTSVSRTLLDLAEVVAPTQLRRAYEAAERLQILDISALNELITRSNGRRGLAALNALLDYDPAPATGSKSDLESAFFDLVRKAGLPLPHLNVLVEGYLVDAYWPAARLVVELQSSEHHAHRQAFDRDYAKLGRLAMAGYTVLPITHQQLMENATWVVEAVDSILRGGRALDAMQPREEAAGVGTRARSLV
jgi:very-short-patch-repair endonuclease